MGEGTIRLWTLHSPDFDLTSGRIDHSRSHYYNDTPGVKKAYTKLWQRLNTLSGQIIWCYTDKTDMPKKTSIKMELWELQVPRHKIICFLNGLVWVRILGYQSDVGKTMRLQWKRDAIKYSPNDSKAYEKKCRDVFWNQKPRTGDWWDELFAEEPGECIDAIIPHPVPEEFVVKKETWLLTPRN